MQKRETRLKYMLLIHGDETLMNSSTTLPDARGMSPAYVAFTDAMIKAGVMRGGERLRPTTAATSVRIRDGKTEVLDGPYAETKEQFGGYYIIEVAGMDEALDWAAMCPSAQSGTVEVRLLWLAEAQQQSQ
jgi:hypothetical protein